MRLRRTQEALSRMPIARTAILAGAVSGAAAVALGAFGAHALRGMLDEHALATWHTAVDYEFWHALALLAIGVIARDGTTVALRCSVFAFIVGTLLFCASLYALALGAPHWIGAITPLGGVALIAGWIALALHAWRRND
jgi:uncharacterized membrane protein YgdD (TMEM256/DUF423 family)